MKRKIINNVIKERKAVGNVIFKIIVGISVLAVFAAFFLLPNIVDADATDEELLNVVIYKNLISFGIFAYLLPFGSIFWEMMNGIYDQNKVMVKIIVCSFIAVGGTLVSLLTWNSTVIQFAMYLSLLSLVFSLIPTIKPEEVKELRENA